MYVQGIMHRGLSITIKAPDGEKKDPDPHRHLITYYSL